MFTPVEAMFSFVDAMFSFVEAKFAPIENMVTPIEGVVAPKKACLRSCQRRKWKNVTKLQIEKINEIKPSR